MKKRESGSKKFSEKNRVFLINILRKLDYKISREKPRSQGHSGDAEGYYESQARGNFPADESRSKLSQRGKTIEKIDLHLKSTLARAPI